MARLSAPFSAAFRFAARLSSAAALLIALAVAPASAEMSFDRFLSDKSMVVLGADRTTTAPGDEVRLVLHKTLTPEWHTYWVNPGGPGMATTIRWEAPEGVEISDIAWPTPERYSVDPYVNYGYADEVLLVSTARVPMDWPAGQPIPLKATAQWLICKDVCIMESQVFEMALNTGATPEVDGEFARLADRAATLWPTELGEVGRYETDADDPSILRIAFPAEALGGATADDGYFYAEAGGIVAAAAPQTVRLKGEEVA